MHVLLLPSWYPETADDLNGTFFRQQALALQAHGLRVGVLAPLFRSLRGDTRTLFSRNYGVKIYNDSGIPTYTARSMLFFPRVPYLDRARWLAAGEKLFARYLAEQGKPDILHAHCVNNGGILAQRLAARYGIPYLITEHSSTYARGLIRPWQRRAMQQAVSQAGRLLAVSKGFCTLLENEFPHSRWHYLPNMLDPAFAAEPPPRTGRTQPFTFCSVGHLHAHKGFDILLHAFALFKQNGGQGRLKIGGGGPQRAALQQLAARLGIAAETGFTGALDREGVRQLMRESDAFVLASRTETFGVVLIEALSQGLPLIATANLGPQSVITAERG
ncbi:MAG: glycosyltransferase, partial [Neisseria sp.]|nr:glycosyltransferase [Neisseria sp.]